MKKRKLGNSDIYVTPIGMGTIQFSQGVGFVGKNYASISQERMDIIVQAAIDGGIDWFDTAEAYGYGMAEQGLSIALKHNEQKANTQIIATKWYPIFRTATNITKTINERLKCLNGYPIDLYQIHLPMSLSPISKQMEKMAQLVKNGNIKAVRVSNFSAEQMKLAYNELKKYNISLISNQVKINLLSREIERNGLLKTAQELNITLIAHSPLKGGLLTGRYHDDLTALERVAPLRRMVGGFNKKRISETTALINKMRDIGKKYDASITQIALNWLITNYGDRVIAIPGASKPEQAISNANVMNFTLSHEELGKLNNISRALSKL